MQIRSLRSEDYHGIVGKVINVPTIVNTLIESLLRSLDYDEAFNIHLDNIVHESSYLS